MRDVGLTAGALSGDLSSPEQRAETLGLGEISVGVEGFETGLRSMGVSGPVDSLALFLSKNSLWCLKYSRAKAVIPHKSSVFLNFGSFLAT